MTLYPYQNYIPKKNYDTKTIIPYILLPKKIMILGDIQNWTETYLMVVTCGNENFNLPPQISAKFLLSSLWRKFLFSEKFFAKTFKRRFSFFFAKIFFSVSVISPVYILCIGKIIKQSKTFRRKFLRIFCFSFTFQQSARTFFYWKRGYFDRL